MFLAQQRTDPEDGDHESTSSSSYSNQLSPNFRNPCFPDATPDTSPPGGIVPSSSSTVSPVSQAASTPTNAWAPGAASAARDSRVTFSPTQLFLRQPMDLKVYQKSAGDTGLQRYATDTPSDAMKCVPYPVDTPTSHNYPLIRSEVGADRPAKEVPLDTTDRLLVPAVAESPPSMSPCNSDSSTDDEPDPPPPKNPQDAMCNGNFLTVTAGMVIGVDQLPRRLSASMCTTASPCIPRSDGTTADNMPGTLPVDMPGNPPDDSPKTPPHISPRTPPSCSPGSVPDHLPGTMQETVETVPSYLPGITPDNSPKPAPDDVPGIAPVERQLPSEGEAVLNDIRPFVYQQQTVGLQLPEIAVHDTTDSVVGGEHSGEEEVCWMHVNYGRVLSDQLHNLLPSSKL